MRLLYNILQYYGDNFYPQIVNFSSVLITSNISAFKQSYTSLHFSPELPYKNPSVIYTVLLCQNLHYSKTLLKDHTISMPTLHCFSKFYTTTIFQLSNENTPLVRPVFILPCSGFTGFYWPIFCYDLFEVNIVCCCYFVLKL